MTVFELAKKYYPRLWSAERIDALVEAGRLTEAQRAEIVSESDPEKGGEAEPDSPGGDGDDP